MATVDRDCPLCGFIHPTNADRLACDARHGGTKWAIAAREVREVFVYCTLCGCADAFDLILEHMRLVESRRDVMTGCLIRSVEDAPDIGTFPGTRDA